MEALLTQTLLPIYQLLTYQVLNPTLLAALTVALIATAYRQLLVSVTTAAYAVQRLLLLIIRQVGVGSSMRFSTKYSVKALFVWLWASIYSLQYVVAQLFTWQSLYRVRRAIKRLLVIQLMLVRCSPQLIRQSPVLVKYLPRLLHRPQRQYWVPHIYQTSRKLPIIAPHLHHILPQYKLVLPHLSQLLRDVNALQPHLQWMMPYLPQLLPHYVQLRQAMPYIQPYLSILLQYRETLIANLHLIAPHLHQLAPQIPELALRLPGIMTLSGSQPGTVKRSKQQRTSFDKLCRSLDVLAPHIGPLLAEFDTLIPHFDLLYKHSAYLLPHINKLVAALPLLSPHLHVILPQLPALAPHLSWLLDNHVQSCWRRRDRIQVFADTVDVWASLLPALVQTKYQMLPLLYSMACNVKLIQQHLPTTRSPTASPTTAALRSPSNSPRKQGTAETPTRRGPLSPTATSPTRLTKSPSVSRLEALKRLSGSQSGSELSLLLQQGQEVEATVILQMLAPHATTLSEHFDELLPHFHILLPQLYDLLPLLNIFVSRIDFFTKQMDDNTIRTSEELLQQLLLTRALPGYSQFSAYTPASLQKLSRSILSTTKQSATDAHSSIQEAAKHARSNSRLFDYAASATTTLGSVAQYLRTPRSSRPASPASGQRDSTFHARGKSESSSLHNASASHRSKSPQLGRAVTNDPQVGRKLFAQMDSITDDIPTVPDNSEPVSSHPETPSKGS